MIQPPTRMAADPGRTPVLGADAERFRNCFGGLPRQDRHGLLIALAAEHTASVEPSAAPELLADLGAAVVSARPGVVRLRRPVDGPTHLEVQRLDGDDRPIAFSVFRQVTEHLRWTGVPPLLITTFPLSVPSALRVHGQLSDALRAS